MPLITLKDDVPPEKNAKPATGPRFRLGCGGHVVLFLLAWVATCQVVFRSAVREAALSGRTPNPDNMGLGWPLFVPFVYRLLAVYWIVRLLVAGAGRRSRRTPPSGESG